VLEGLYPPHNNIFLLIIQFAALLQLLAFIACVCTGYDLFVKKSLILRVEGFPGITWNIKFLTNLNLFNPSIWNDS